MPQFNVGNLKSKKIYTKSFGNFLGLDVYNNPINVDVHRSPKMKNFIFKDGANRKRSGFIQKALFSNTKINGYWEFTDSVTNTKHCIVHAGTSIYKIVFNDSPGLNEVTTLSTGLSGILNQKSYGIVRNNVLYILTGQNYLMYSNINNVWALREVTNYAYIPTTRINVSSFSSGVNVSAPLEDVNMLQPFRYNTLIGEYKPITKYTDFGVDSAYSVYDYYVGYKVENYSRVVDGVAIKIINNNSILATLKVSITGTKKTYSYDSQNSPVTTSDQEVLDLINVISANSQTNPVGKLWIETFVTGNSLFFDMKIGLISGNDVELEFLYGNEVLFSNYDVSVYNLDASTILAEGFEIINTDTNTTLSLNTDYTIDTAKGYVTIKTNQAPQIPGQGNLRVKFKSSNSTESIEKIKKCTFGTMFGYNEEQQFFVSGNPDYPNYDWHTSTRYEENTNVSNLSEQEDLTYFSDRSYFMIGSPSNKVSGYTLLNDNTLAIHKTESSHETSLWIRNSFLTTKLDSNGDEIVNPNTGATYKGVEYSQVSSANGEACISDKSCKNLNGDKLFLSKNGIFSVTLDSNIKSNERYATLRSKLINNQLLQENNLEKSVSIVFNGKYYLAIGNHIYIADSQYLYSEGDYEWWYWELEHSLTISTFFVRDDKLWFGTEDGRLCAFDDTGYKDVIYDDVTATLQDVDDEESNIYHSITYDNNYNKAFNYGMVVPNNLTDSLLTAYDDRYVYQILAVGSVSADNSPSITISNNDYQRMLKYFLTEDESESEVNVYAMTQDGFVTDGEYTLKVINETAYGDYVVKLLNNSSNEYKTFNEDDTIYIFTKLDGRIKTKLVSTKVKLLKPDDENYIDFVNPAATSIHFLAYIEMPVTAIWWTPIVDLGNPMYAKTLNHITIVPNAYGDGEMYIGYLTKDNYVSSRTEGVDLFELSNFDLEYFSTDPSKFMRAFSKKLKVKKFNFIQFVIKSDADRECSTNEFMISYYMTKKNKGVK